ncbi:MAG: disulfide bond formation protein B [Alphaproteobacteria bacterium]|nr:disulfide bond formation protein B [Alphaproteobacteria bacterium]
MIGALRKRPFTEQALVVAALTSGALLLGAHIFEWLGYAPCQLCLDEREAHWTALAVASAGLFAHFVFRAPLGAAAAVGAAALVYAASAGLAFFHVGVEFHFWPGPATCSGGGQAITDAADLASALSRKFHGPSCDQAAWRFLGVSMAGYNLLFSAGLFALTLSAAFHAARAAREARRPARETQDAETA